MNAVTGLLAFLLLLSRRTNGFFATRSSTTLGRWVTVNGVSSDDPTEWPASDHKNLFHGFETLDFTLVEHKPLGCTVEESLADAAALPVFISKVTEGGLADKAGLKVGDVIVGVSGIFGELSSVVGVGIDQVKRLVGARPQEKPLKLRVARGTSVMSKHETALVDLCALPSSDEKEVEQCISSFLSEGYDINDDFVTSECDDGTECLLDGMFNMWNQEMQPIPVQTPALVNEEPEPRKPAPWSSRSSPSGTWVRDPKTGEMRNIDIQ